MLKIETDRVKIQIVAGDHVFVETPDHSDFFEWAELTPDQQREVVSWTEKLCGHFETDLPLFATG
jgi:hypothetical protein